MAWGSTTLTMEAVEFVNNCTARQCSPFRRKFMECSVISPALSLLMKHLVIGQRQKAANFWVFHLSPHGSLVSIGQHFVTTRLVLITDSDLSGPCIAAIAGVKQFCYLWRSCQFSIGCDLALPGYLPLNPRQA